MESIDNQHRTEIIEKAGSLMAMRADHGRDVAVDAAITGIIASIVFLENEIGPRKTLAILLSAAGGIRPVA